MPCEIYKRFSLIPCTVVSHNRVTFGQYNCMSPIRLPCILCHLKFIFCKTPLRYPPPPPHFLFKPVPIAGVWWILAGTDLYVSYAVPRAGNQWASIYWKQVLLLVRMIVWSNSFSFAWGSLYSTKLTGIRTWLINHVYQFICKCNRSFIFHIQM